MEKSTKIKFLKTFSFYIIYLSFAYIMDYFFPSDMCNPGLGVVMIFFLPIIVLILLIRNTIKFFMWGKPYDKSYLIPIYIHFLTIIIAFIIAFVIN